MDKIVWTDNSGKRYTMKELQDDHLRNIVVKTLHSPSFSASKLRKEARRRQLFLVDGWDDGTIPAMAIKYLQTNSDLYRQLLADLLEEQGSPIHEWIRRSPEAYALVARFPILGETNAQRKRDKEANLRWANYYHSIQFDPDESE